MKKLIILSERSPRWVVNLILRGKNREVKLLFSKAVNVYRKLRYQGEGKQILNLIDMLCYNK